MRFGHFDDAAWEHVLTSPRTAIPWIHCPGQEDCFGPIANTAGGSAFCKGARLRRLPRCQCHNVRRDDGGRYVRIRGDDGVWPPGWEPVRG